MSLITFDLENLIVDWISFNINGLTSKDDVKRIASHLSSHFTPSIVMGDNSKIAFSGFKNKYHVSLRQYTQTNWVGTQVIFSGKNAAYFYKLIKTQKFNWRIFKVDQCTLSLGRIDLCFSIANGFNFTRKSFDTFLVDSRHKTQTQTNTRYIKLANFPEGRMLKINRRNNSLHYRVYQKNETVRFELEFKHRQTKLVQDYLFNNKFDIFEDKLVNQYFKFSGRVLDVDSKYSDWIVDFQRRNQQLNNYNNPSLLTSYLDHGIGNQEEEDRLFHLLQFLSFVRSLALDPYKDCKKHRIKRQFYYSLKFPLSKFVKFTGIKISNHSERKNLIGYFEKLQKLDPIVKRFSNHSFRSYVCFPYVSCDNPSGVCWEIDLVVAEELFYFTYPFQLPKSFLSSTHINDRRLKLRFLKSLAVSSREKVLDIEEFFNRINVPNNQLIKIKRDIIQLLDELVENSIIQNKIEIMLKSGKKRAKSIKDLTVSDITQRIKYIKFDEKISNL